MRKPVRLFNAASFDAVFFPYLAMLPFRILKIRPRALLCHDHMVSVDGDRQLSLWQSCADELQQGHGCRGIVTCCTVRIQLEERLSAVELLVFRFAKVPLSN